jgi:hypothetical protein
MRRLAPVVLFALAVGYALAHFAVAFYNHWYFAQHFWLKVGLLTPPLALLYGVALYTDWGRIWRILGCWWIAVHLLAMVPAGGPDLRELEFVAVLDLEVAVVWAPTALLAGYGLWQLARRRRAEQRQRRLTARELKLRRRLRRGGAGAEPGVMANHTEGEQA